MATRSADWHHLQTWTTILTFENSSVHIIKHIESASTYFKSVNIFPLKNGCKAFKRLRERDAQMFRKHFVYRSVIHEQSRNMETFRQRFLVVTLWRILYKLLQKTSKQTNDETLKLSKVIKIRYKRYYFVARFFFPSN
jgi:hypothetical protein